jgi:hypothetical protein
MRSPRLLLADLGFTGFVSFQLVVGGSVLAALIHPLVLAGFLYSYLAGLPFFGDNGPLITTLAWIYGAALGAGYLTSIFLGLRGLKRRGLLRVAGWLAAVPLHWLLLSLAAWRALYQLLRDPQRWEKTEHGLARSSRRAKLASRTTLGAARGGEGEFRREAAE